MSTARKIAIIGSAYPRNVLKVLRGMQGYERWSVNGLWAAYPRMKFARWFELHKFEKRGRRYYRRDALTYGPYNTIAEYMRGIDRLRVPTYMQRHWPLVKLSRAFPFNEIMATLGTQYFGCSFAWMIGLALWEHLQGDTVSEIALLGATLTTHEYYFQRPSTEYLIGRAQGLGITVTIDPTSNLLTAPYIYAYQEDSTLIDVNYVSVVRELATMAAIPMQYYFEGLCYGRHGTGTR